MRRDWRETIALAADLALLGLLMVAAALPVVTAGAAVATGSAAVDRYLTDGGWPGVKFCWRVFRRSLLPGFGATLACAAAAALVVLDLQALRAGRVPGGLPLMAVTIAVAALAAGYGGLALAGSRDRGAGVVVKAAGVIVLAVLLAVLVHPVLVPVLAGYTLFALHVLARRAERLHPRADGVGQGADAGDRDRHDVPGLEGEVQVGDDAGAGGQHHPVGVGVAAE
jgi:hypothetical protein